MGQDPDLAGIDPTPGTPRPGSVRSAAPVLTAAWCPRSCLGVPPSLANLVSERDGRAAYRARTWVKRITLRVRGALQGRWPGCAPQRRPAAPLLLQVRKGSTTLNDITLTDHWLDEERFVASLTLFFEGGLLIIDDVEASSEHDDWDSLAQPVHRSGASIHVGVRSAGSGPVRVDVFRGSDLPPYTRGMIQGLNDNVEMPSGVIEVRDSAEDQGTVVHLGEDSRTRVQVLLGLDSAGEVDHVVVSIGALGTS